MHRKALALLGVSALLLTGCGTSTTSDNAPSESAVSAATQEVYENVTSWQGTTETGAVITVSVDKNAPAGVDEARSLMQADGQLSYLRVTVDNRQGTEEHNLSSISFTDPDGNLTEYDLLSQFLNYQGSAAESDVDASNRVIDIHNLYSSDEYKTAAGQKQTLYLASDASYPTKITHALEGTTNVLSPSETEAEAGTQQEIPAASTEASTTNVGKTFFSGTTLKGNDISFEILDDATQTDLNGKTQEFGLVGAWGRLCSAGAVIAQLEETGVLTQSPVNEDSYVWRSVKYAVAEGGRVSDSEIGVISEAFGAGASGQVDGKNCILVNTDMKWALDYDYDFVTVGQYVGSKELLNTVEIY